MTKKNKLNEPKQLDDYGVDDIDKTLNEFEDMYKDKTKDNRKPILMTTKGFFSSFDPRQSGMDMLKSVGFAALPTEYSFSAREAVSLYGDVNDIFRTASDEFKPFTNTLKAAAKESLSVTSKFLPKSLVEKIKGFDTGSSSGNYMDYNSNETDIKNTLQSIFDAQTTIEKNKIDVDNAKSDIDRTFSNKQFVYGANLSKITALGISKLANYQETILDQYYRKSLELQHRQYFSTRDLVQNTKASNYSILELLRSIRENTGLPNEVKIKNSEMFSNTLKQNLTGRIQDYTRGKLGYFVNNLKTNLQRNFRSFAQEMQGNYEMLEGASKMFDMDDLPYDMEDKDNPYHLAGKAFFGDPTQAWLGKKIGLKLKDKIPEFVNKFHPEAFDTIKKVGYKAANIAENGPSMLVRKMGDSDSYIGNSLYELFNGGYKQSETINKNLRAQATEPTPWDVISRRTLIEIIPGYLSRQLEKLTWIYESITGVKEKSDRLVFNTDRETFIPKKENLNIAKNMLKKSFNYTVKSSINDIINFIDDGSGLLTPKDRALLSIQLAKDAADNIDFDPTIYATIGNLHNGINPKISTLFFKAFNMQENKKGKIKIGSNEKDEYNHYTLSKKFNDIRDNIGNYTNTFNTLYSTGETDALRDLGTVNSKGQIDHKYKWNMLNELLDSNSYTDFFNQNDTGGDTTEYHNQAELNPNNLFNQTQKKTPKSSKQKVDIKIDGIDNIINSLSSITNTINSNSTLNTKTDTSIVPDKLEELINLQRETSENQSSLLERIAEAVENIKYAGGSHMAGPDDSYIIDKHHGYFGHLIRTPLHIAKGAFSLFKGARQIGRATRPYKNYVMDKAGKLVKPVGSLGYRTAAFGLESAGKLAGYGIRGGVKAALSVPKAIYNVGKGAGWVGGKAYDYLSAPTSTTAKWLYGKAGDAGAYGLNTVINLPSNLSKGFGRLKRVAKKPIGITGYLGGKLAHGIAGLGDMAAEWGLGRKVLYDRVNRSLSSKDEDGNEIGFLDRLKSHLPEFNAPDFHTPEFIKNKIDLVKNFNYDELKKHINEKINNPESTSLKEKINSYKDYFKNKINDNGFFNGIKTDISDIYKKGIESEPVLTLKGMMNLEYFDKLTGTPIRSFKDLKGAVVDKSGNVVLTIEDYLNGFVDKDGNPIKINKDTILANLKKYIPENLKKTVFTNGKSVLDKLKSVYEKTYHVIDVYVKGETTPRLKASIMKMGGYLDVKTKKVLHSVNHIRGEVRNLMTGSIDLTYADLETGLVDVHGKPIKILHGSPKKIFEFASGLFKTVKGSINNPFGAATSMLGKAFDVFSNRDSKVVDILNKIYKHLTKILPTGSSDDETEEDGSNFAKIKNMLKRKKDANAKQTPPTTTDANKVSDVMPKGPKDEDKGGIDSVIDTAEEYGIKGLEALGVYKAGASMLGAETATAATAAVETAVVTSGSVLATIGSGLTLLGGIVFSPQMATAAAVAAAGYGIYKGYRYLRNNRELQPIETIRYLQYGIPTGNKYAVSSVRELENSMDSELDIGTDGKVKQDSSNSKDLYLKYCSIFNCSPDSQNDYTRFTNWFYKRFMPVYVKHAVVARNLKTDLTDIDNKLTNEQKSVFLTSIQFGEKESKMGLNPFTVMDSPWPDIRLKVNNGLIDVLTTRLLSSIGRNKDTSIKTFIDVKSTDNKDTDKIDKDEQKINNDYLKFVEDKKAREQAENSKSFVDNAADWSKQNLLPIYNKAKEISSKSYESLKNVAKAGYKTIDKNIIQPVKNSLAGLLQGGESGTKGYNAYNRGTVGQRILGPLEDRALTNMTIAEILNESKRQIGDPKRLFAVGKYQMIPSTLEEGVKALGVDPNTKFDERTQDYLFSNYLLDRKRKRISSFIKGKTDDALGAVDDASNEWASVADPDTGYSHYGSGNKASITVDKMYAAMNKSRALYKYYITQGMSESEAYQRAVSTDTDVPATNENTTVASAANGVVNNLVPTENKQTNNNVTDSKPDVKMASSLPSKIDDKTSIFKPSAAETHEDSLSTINTLLEPKPADIPDLSHISKATTDVGDKAFGQRNKQLEHLQNQTELLKDIKNLLKDDKGGKQNAPQPVLYGKDGFSRQPINSVVDISKKEFG